MCLYLALACDSAPGRSPLAGCRANLGGSFTSRRMACSPRRPSPDAEAGGGEMPGGSCYVSPALRTLPCEPGALRSPLCEPGLAGTLLWILSYIMCTSDLWHGLTLGSREHASNASILVIATIKELPAHLQDRQCFGTGRCLRINFATRG